MRDPNFKPFSEYRDKDYVTPRSMKEAYGHDPVLYTIEEEKELSLLTWMRVVTVVFLSAALAVVLWVI